MASPELARGGATPHARSAALDYQAWCKLTAEPAGGKTHRIPCLGHGGVRALTLGDDG